MCSGLVSIARERIGFVAVIKWEAEAQKMARGGHLLCRSANGLCERQVAGLRGWRVSEMGGEVSEEEKG